MLLTDSYTDSSVCVPDPVDEVNQLMHITRGVEHHPFLILSTRNRIDNKPDILTTSKRASWQGTRLLPVFSGPDPKQMATLILACHQHEPPNVSFEFVTTWTRFSLAHHVCPKLVPEYIACLLYTSPSPRDRTRSRMPSSA
eukprot:TRINITY_DN557_c0_g1_i11.p2 TRINITY_DN557_c0_g1~~TRINITY_DN557_c0_g1_i11.p2  ORF type:complete len:141 (-),score=22.12 TRINITY_DN557_c0_g1_i11:97-519(-)